MRILPLTIVVFTILTAFPGLLLAEDQTAKLQSPLFDNLGSFHFPISTNTPLSQRFFDQGFVLYYGFEWGESIRSFKEATRLDPHCGMCYWGLALALGSKMNAPMSGHEYSDANAAIQKALLLKNYATPKERAYIRALSLRFQHKPKPANSTSGTFSCHMAAAAFDASSKKELLDYAQAMKKVSAAYPEDNNAEALYAYAVFNSIEWKFWDENGKMNSLTPALTDALKSILAKDPLHIGGNHYYIHVIEQSPQPEVALSSADILRTLVPGAEHLVHMPAHIYFLTGRYHQGSESNIQAIAVFKEYNKICREQGFSPEINYLYLHNYDFLRTTATMEGRKQLALSAAREIQDPPFSAWLVNESSLQWFIPIHYYVEARFGMWRDILHEPKPSPKYQYALGMWHYARGMALAHTGDIKNAEQESLKLDKIIQRGPAENNLQQNGIHLLSIGAAVLKAAPAVLKNSNFRYSCFEGVYLKSCDLSESIFVNTDFTNAVLDESNFTNAVFSSPILFHTSFNKADFRNANISGVELPKIAFADIKICEWQAPDLLEEYGIIVFPNTK